MVDAFYAQNDQFQIIQNDDISFDTDRKSIQLFPDSTKIISNSFDVDFPDVVQAVAYYYGTPGSISTCETWSILIWQEWGPTEVSHDEVYFPGNPPDSIPGPTTRNLPAILLGTVPSGTDYIDVRVNLTQTVTPPLFLNTMSPLPFFQEGQWTGLPGGSCPVELSYNLIRMFNIVLIGTSVYLHRYQSVFNANTGYNTSMGGAPEIDINGNQSDGWSTWGNLNVSGPQPKSRANPGVRIQLKPASASQKRPGGADHCNFTSFPNLRSRYQGSIIIHPGRYS